MGSYQALNGLRQCSNVLCETSWLVEPVLWLPLPPASGGARKNMTHWGGGMSGVPPSFIPAAFTAPLPAGIHLQAPKDWSGWDV